MDNSPNINIEIRFVDSATFGVAVVIDALKLIEESATAIEREELVAFKHRFPNIPQVAYDAARYRIQDSSLSSLNLRSASNGSIVLFGMVAATAYWLLEKTLGETISAAWIESDLHKNIKDFLLSRLDQKTSKLVQQISKRGKSRTRLIADVSGASRAGFHSVVVTIRSKAESTVTPDPTEYSPEQPDDSK